MILSQGALTRPWAVLSNRFAVKTAAPLGWVVQPLRGKDCGSTGLGCPTAILEPLENRLISVGQTLLSGQTRVWETDHARSLT
jgi:hypothetical protein